MSEKEKRFILEDPVVMEQVAEILRRGIARADAAGDFKRSCQHCDQPIVRPADRWVHVAGERRGCRAASLNRLGTRDNTLKENWKATPKKVRNETDDEPFPPETLENIHEAFVGGLEAEYPGTTWRVV